MNRRRIYSFLTRSRFLHLEDALSIGKVRLFVGEYRRGEGASATAYHYVDVDDARVVFHDLAAGRPVNFTDYKGTPGDEPQSRVLKIKANSGKVWIEVANGPGQVIGEGAVKPAGKPDVAVSVPLTTWEARRLGHAALAYIRAWETRYLLDVAPVVPQSPVYGDGTKVDLNNQVEQDTFRAYAAARGGEVPPSREALRAWWRQQNGGGA